MLEKDFQSIVTHTFNSQNGWCYKIPDNGFDTKPYDCYGFHDGMSYVMELKWLNKPQAFNFNRLEQHQIDNLIKTYEIMGDNVRACFIVGIDYGRLDKRVFIFCNDQLYDIKKRKEEKKNLLKKDFQNRPYLKIKNKIVQDLL